MYQTSEGTKEQENTLFELKTKIIFSNIGSTALSKNIQPRRFVLADGTEQFGLELRKYNPVILQKMILERLVFTAQISSSRIQEERKDLLKFTQLIVRCMLAFQFDLDMWDLIHRSEAVQKWNRAHPKNPLDSKTTGNSKHIRDICKENEKEISTFKQYIYYALKNKSYDKKTIEIYLSTLRPLVWVILLSLKSNKEKKMMLDTIVNSLIGSLHKITIGEYIGLLILELVSFLQTMENSRNRKIDNNSKEISILWKMPTKNNNTLDRINLSVILCDTNMANRDIGFMINSRAQKEVDKKTLKEIYNTSILESNQVYTLGLYYLSFLKEECKKENIFFNAYVSHGVTGNTFIHLKFLW